MLHYEHVGTKLCDMILYDSAVGDPGAKLTN